jgi:hypothetical protein
LDLGASFEIEGQTLVADVTTVMETTTMISSNKLVRGAWRLVALLLALRDHNCDGSRIVGVEVGKRFRDLASLLGVTFLLELRENFSAFSLSALP